MNYKSIKIYLVLSILIIINFIIITNSQCLPTWSRRCVRDSDCCSDYCSKKYRNYGTGVCRHSYIKPTTTTTTTTTTERPNSEYRSEEEDELNCGTTYKSFTNIRIVGGAPAELGQYPWMVSLTLRQSKTSTEGYHICGGSILNHYYILTAAHCFAQQKSIDQYSIIAGKLNVEKDQKLLDISKIIIHPKYDKRDKFFKNDVALIKLENYLPFDDYQKPICLPAFRQRISQHGEALVAGWGRTYHHGPTSPNLLHTGVKIVSLRECMKVYPKIIKSSICAGIGRNDSCEGDSGGPLMKEIENQMHVFGIVSFGKGCADAGSPGVYAKVSDYVKWIKNQISG